MGYFPPPQFPQSLKPQKWIKTKEAPGGGASSGWWDEAGLENPDEQQYGECQDDQGQQEHT